MIRIIFSIIRIIRSLFAAFIASGVIASWYWRVWMYHGFLPEFREPLHCLLRLSCKNFSCSGENGYDLVLCNVFLVCFVLLFACILIKEYKRTKRGQWTGNMEGIREKMTGKFEHSDMKVQISKL